jgi:hypothetical protein
MANENKMSRRDWFRLRPYRAAPEKIADRNEHSMGDQSQNLQPVPQPVNHDGMDLSELPPMREAFLSEEQVRQLFNDIETLASDILLMQRTPGSQRAIASRATIAAQLHQALESLLSGTIPRIQIRYHWQQMNWIDTLEHGENSIRLIRIAHIPTAS